MRKLEFNTEMFNPDNVKNFEIHPEAAVYIAQKAFDEWLEKQTVVYGQLAVQNYVWNTKNPEWHDTHKAYLVCIEEIKECEHNGHIIVIQKGLFKCSDCDKELKPKNGWEEL